MKFTYKRSERVKEVIREEIANILATGEISDRGEIGFTTVTHVDLSSDLRNMTIYVSVLADGPERTATLETLNRLCGLFRKLLSRRLPLKRVPELKFKFDPSIEYSQKISNILDNIKDENN